MRTNDEIITYLTELKDKQGLSISEIARRVGMAKSTVSRYFNRTREFPVNDVDAFANAFHVSSTEILGMRVQHSTNEAAETVAAHIDEDTPAQEREQIINFIENLKKARK